MQSHPRIPSIPSDPSRNLCLTDYGKTSRFNRSKTMALHSPSVLTCLLSSSMMLSRSFTLAFLGLVVCLVSFTTVTVVQAGSDTVLELTPDTFDEFVGREQGVLVEFFAPWCGHCKALAPHYAAVASAFAPHAGKVRIASVDADQYSGLASRFQIQGFPTIYWFPPQAVDGAVEYPGSNNAAAITEFLNEKTGLQVPVPQVAQKDSKPKVSGKPGAVSAVLKLNPDNIDQYIGGDKPILVEFFAPWCGHCKALAPHYELAAQAFRDFSASSGAIVHVASLDADAFPAVGHQFGVTGFPTLKFFPAGSKEAQEYSGARTAEGLVSFLNNKLGVTAPLPESADFDAEAESKEAAKAAFAYPSVLHLTPENIEEHIGSGAPVPMLVEFYAPWCQHCKSLAPEYEEAAAAFKGVQGGKIAGLDGDKYPKLATAHGVKGFPTILFFAKGATKGVEYDGPRTAAGLVKYLNTHAGTNVPVPGLQVLSSGSTNVVQLSLDNYETVVEDAEKNVVVYFYAPWCPHLPEYTAAADLLKQSGSDVILAALDCDEYPKLAEHVEAFPTVYFYGATVEPETDAVTKKSGSEIDLSPSTTAAQLVTLIQAHLAGEIGTDAPAATPSSATPSKPAAASTAGLVSHPPQTVTLGKEGDALFFNCDVTNTDASIEPAIGAGTELKIEARNAEVQGFPTTFSIDAEQFATYNWLAKPASDATATITVSFAAPVSPTLKLECHQGRQTTKPDVASVAN